MIYLSNVDLKNLTLTSCIKKVEMIITRKNKCYLEKIKNVNSNSQKIIISPKAPKGVTILPKIP